MSWRRLEGIFSVIRLCKTSWRRSGRRKIVTLKTCWRRLQHMSWKCLQDVLKTNKCFFGTLLGIHTNTTRLQIHFYRCARICFKYRSITGFFKWPLTRFYFIKRNEEYTNWSRFLETQQLVIKQWNFKINLKDIIKNTKSKLTFNVTQLNWELLKNEIRKFIISYSKAIVKEERARRLKLENTLKFLENNLSGNLKKQQYELLKCELDEIYDKIAEGVIVWSRSQQYEEGEKSNKFFLN